MRLVASVTTRVRRRDGRNGERHPPRPRIELLTKPASESEAAAIVAAMEQFLAETAPPPSAGGLPGSRWQRAALEEGVSARDAAATRGGRGRAAERLGRCPRLPRGPFRIEHRPQPDEQEEKVAVVKIIELVGSSKTSTDDAAKQALKQAQSSLRNIRAVDIVSTGIRGENLDEYRAHVRVAFLIEGTDVD